MEEKHRKGPFLKGVWRDAFNNSTVQGDFTVGWRDDISLLLGNLWGSLPPQEEVLDLTGREERLDLLLRLWVPEPDQDLDPDLNLVKTKQKRTVDRI